MIKEFNFRNLIGSLFYWTLIVITVKLKLPLWNLFHWFIRFFFHLFFVFCVFCLSSNHQTDWYFLQTKIPSGCMKINIFTFQFRSVFLAFLPLNNGKSIYIPSYFSCCGGKNKWFQGKYVYRMMYQYTNFSLIRFIINKTWTTKDIQHLHLQ